MFEPEIFGLSSSMLWSLAQALVAPALGFLFLYLMRLPLSELSILPIKTEYTPPRWVLPVFAHGLSFLLVAIVSTNLFLNRLHERELADELAPDLFLVRDFDMKSRRPTKVAAVLESYDGLSGLKIFANGYHVFGSNRDCVASFQCTSDAAKADEDMKKFIAHRDRGGAVYELNKTNSLPYEVVLNHYLTGGENYLDVISENSGTGSCELSVAIVLTSERDQQERYLVSIHPYRAPDGGQEPKRRRPLAGQEVFYSGGPADGHMIERYKTPTLERRNVVCERIRISVKLSEEQARTLSNDADFESHYLSRQKAY